MIEVRGVTKRYGATTAVDDLSFRVRPGQVTGFLGPNGSGKSTTMRLILGLDRPDAGVARVNGRPYAELPWPLREVGALVGVKAFHPGRSAGANLLALARANAITRSRVDDVLDMVGLADVAGRRAGTFSLGMGQRLGIAAAMLGDPGVLLFDEPVNGLDPDGIIWIRGLLGRLAAEGRTVFVSSHLISEMALSAEQLVLIGKGRLLVETSVADLIACSSGRRVRLRAPDDGPLVRALVDAGARTRRETDGTIVVDGMDAPAIAELAAARHIVLYELTTHAASLEDAYLELTHSSVDYRGTGEHPPVLAAGRDGRIIR